MLIGGPCKALSVSEVPDVSGSQVGRVVLFLAAGQRSAGTANLYLGRP